LIRKRSAVSEYVRRYQWSPLIFRDVAPHRVRLSVKLHQPQKLGAMGKLTGASETVTVLKND
jgi:hypothetical protein